MKNILRIGPAAVLAAGFAAVPAHAATIIYTFPLMSLNDVGSGSAYLTLDNVANTLQVNITANGLDDGPHLAHFHGRFSGGVMGMPVNSVLPGPGSDDDGDGFIELAEALPDYGPIILPLGTIGTGSSIDFSQTFDLTDSSIYGFVGGDMSLGRYGINDLIGADGMALDLREIVVHGQFAPAVGEGTPGEVDGTAGYKPVLPTIAGAVAPIPEPATWAMMLLGFGAIGSIVRRRRKVSVSYA